MAFYQRLFGLKSTSKKALFYTTYFHKKVPLKQEELFLFYSKRIVFAQLINCSLESS